MQALQGQLAVPNWREFCETVTEIYHHVYTNVGGGANATSIPILKDQVRENICCLAGCGCVLGGAVWSACCRQHNDPSLTPHARRQPSPPVNTEPPHPASGR